MTTLNKDANEVKTDIELGLASLVAHHDEVGVALVGHDAVHRTLVVRHIAGKGGQSGLD